MMMWLREKYLAYLGRQIAKLDRMEVSDTEKYEHMNKLGKLRFKFDQTLKKQMAARAAKGIKEIETRVEWL